MVTTGLPGTVTAVRTVATMRTVAAMGPVTAMRSMTAMRTMATMRTMAGMGTMLGQHGVDFFRMGPLEQELIQIIGLFIQDLLFVLGQKCTDPTSSYGYFVVPRLGTPTAAHVAPPNADNGGTLGKTGSSGKNRRPVAIPLAK